VVGVPASGEAEAWPAVRRLLWGDGAGRRRAVCRSATGVAPRSGPTRPPRWAWSCPTSCSRARPCRRRTCPGGAVAERSRRGDGQPLEVWSVLGRSWWVTAPRRRARAPRCGSGRSDSVVVDGGADVGVCAARYCRCRPRRPPVVPVPGRR
jgi:hypothetical protein